MVYESNLVNTWVNRAGHRWVEKHYSEKTAFSRVLEVGAGSGEHLDHIKHQYDQYYLTDANSDLLGLAQKRHQKNEKVIFEQRDALDLPYDDSSFDRLISIYSLEHIVNPHLAIREWKRVFKPGGIITISIPTEGGIAWNLGRYLTTRRYFKKKGLDLDYLIAREHVNACYRLHAFIKFYFPRRNDNWFPLLIPTPHCNLVYSCNAINDGEIPQESFQ
jgi:ubiquinone/menaquinone biosynthesis C-methylase UbiE